MKRPLHARLILALWALGASASAHTAVTSATPGDGKTVSAPKEVVMTFNEPVSLRFSTFKVYPLGTDGSALVVNRAAAKLTKAVIGAKNDEDARADLPLKSSDNVTKVTLPLKAPLNSGPYVVMWRILSADGHPLTGQYVFRVK